MLEHVLLCGHLCLFQRRPGDLHSYIKIFGVSQPRSYAKKDKKTIMTMKTLRARSHQIRTEPTFVRQLSILPSRSKAPAKFLLGLNSPRWYPATMDRCRSHSDRSRNIIF